MPFRIRQLMVNRADEIRKAERWKRDASDVIFFSQGHEALPVEDGKLERGKVPGEFVGTGIVIGGALGKHKRHQHVFRQRSDDVRFNRLKTFVPGPDAVEAKMDTGVVVVHLPPDLSEVGCRYSFRLHAEFDAGRVVHGDR
jgi:hypothetical protein